MLRHLTVFCLLAVASPIVAQTNPVFEEVTKKGVALAKGPAIKLPAPTMPDGLDAAGQRKAIESIAEGGRTYDTLTGKAVVAPFVLKVTDDKDSAAAGGTGRRVDLCFVAYGDLKKLAESGFGTPGGKESKAKPDDGGTNAKGVELKPEDLKKRGIEPLAADKFKESYNHAEFTLFDRVRIHGTMRSVQTETPESQFVAGVLDDRFKADKEFPNAWQPVIRDETTGKTSLGPLQPYSGAGSYMKATQLKEPAGAIFVEYHIAFDEPKGWFGGANLLRSKLAIVVQDNVRKLRRKLDEKK